MNRIQLQINMRLFDQHDDKIAEYNGDALSPMLKEIKSIKYKYGKLRITYDPNMQFYNEGTFENATQAKVLATVFREKAIWDFIRGAS